MMRILVTYGWCRTAYIAAESLRRAGFEVYACGSTALSMVRVSRFVRGFDRVPDPFKEPEQYVTEISALVKRRNIDVLLPVHEDAFLIEMSPRFGGALNLAVENGFDFPRGLVTMLTKGEPDSDCFKLLLQPVGSLWIVGEIIAGVAEFRPGKGLAPLASAGRILRGRSSPAHLR